MDSVDKSAFYIYVILRNKLARLGKGYSTMMLTTPFHLKINGLQEFTNH